MDPDAIWGGDLGRMKDVCIRFGWRLVKGMGNFGGECGHPIVTSGDFVAYRTCVKEHKVIKWQFWMVSGVSREMGVLDGGSHLERGREGFGGISPLV